MPKLITFCAALALAGSAAGAGAGGPAGALALRQAGAAPKAKPPVVNEPSPSPALARALERALAEGWQELHIETECRNDAGRLERAEIFASGIGIWNREAQFQLTRTQIEDRLEAFRGSGFTDWPVVFGGKSPPMLQDTEQNQPPRVVCRVVLELDGVGKQVSQYQKGPQSAELRQLAFGILEACQGPGQSGVRATSLNDGLERVAAGDLAPETFQVIASRPRPPGEKAGEGDSWLLRIDRGAASLRPRTPEGGSDDMRVLELGEQTLARLAGQLRKADLAGLPSNLYAERYTDVLVRVLDHRVQIQARRFAGMTNETHGDQQKRFDEALEALQALRALVSEDGRPRASTEGPR